MVLRWLCGAVVFIPFRPSHAKLQDSNTLPNILPQNFIRVSLNHVIFASQTALLASPGAWKNLKIVLWYTNMTAFLENGLNRDWALFKPVWFALICNAKYHTGSLIQSHSGRLTTHFQCHCSLCIEVPVQIWGQGTNLNALLSALNSQSRMFSYATVCVCVCVCVCCSWMYWKGY